MKRFAAPLLLMCTIGCASYGSVADTYGGKGMHEIAAFYRGAQHLDNPSDEKATAALSSTVDSAAKALDADFDRYLQSGDATHALGVAERKEDVLRYGKALGAAQYDAAALDATTVKAQAAAAKAALARVDALETSDAPPEQLLAALRVAQAMSPDDAELASRYTRLREKLTLNVAVRVNCGPGSDNMTCQQFANRLVMHVIGSDSELVRIVPPQSPSINADMIVSLNATFADSQWQTVRRGRAEAQVERKNKFDEPQRGPGGALVMDTVAANYTLYERTARAAMRATVTVRDATPAHKVLFASTPSQEVVDQRKFVDWSGDERALGSAERVGTDQTPPNDPLVLSIQGAHEMAAATAAQLVHTLDGK